ncbi:hypothetical protein EKO27_g9216 [Xylaria grammica]|uniref:Uncharacterized protein n=1 Tax=Xylaria grammica TaxID=363999 RepID=A0A439CUY7_9PEZI|nr:hypothetical protein F5X98DRAFT_345022 [Xylaria grammica]RWA05891.1 hypothetical protein EKO27_g9216 [Xylaria grammica]GAW13381.1 hypothetical protein ANO14919_027650 [Xylariales sp. No.14919]
MPHPTFQTITTSAEEKQLAEKRRHVYLRPFFLFWLNCFIFEATMLAVSIFFFAGFRDLFPRFMWTIFFCPLGMGGAMGGLVNHFVVDKHYGSKAAHFLGILSVLVLGACNILCYNLDLVFGWFGAANHYWWWHWRYIMMYGMGWVNGKLMFTDEGQERLAAWGI